MYMYYILMQKHLWCKKAEQSKVKYRIVGKFGEIGELSMICQTIKPSNLLLTINNLLADLLICQTFPLYSTFSSGLFITKTLQ